DSEIDVPAIDNIAGEASGHGIAIQGSCDRCSVHADTFAVLDEVESDFELGLATTMRLTKMPGVTTASGSSAPNSTRSWTCAMVSFPAMAITGLKLRPVAR